MPVETDRSKELRELAQRVTDALPPDVAQEVIVTGSVSRGVADAVSDIEMLVVTPEVLPLETCFEHARAAGLTNLGTWGRRTRPRAGSPACARACRWSSSGGRASSPRARCRRCLRGR